MCIGIALAFNRGYFDALIAGFAICTALLLQMLSNLANDYGDFKKGTDNPNRIGPERVLQGGHISPEAMKNALYLFSGASFISGLLLLNQVRQTFTVQELSFFLVLGILSIAAAIMYTVGKKAYGYIGLGDFIVFIFFGPIGVAGTYYLLSHRFDPDILLPASSIGLLATGVLNMNNTRDIENDLACGKITIPVRLGLQGARIYHLVIISIAIAAAWTYLIFFTKGVSLLLFFLVIPVFFYSLRIIFRTEDYKMFDKQLKITVIGTILFTIVYSYLLVRDTMV
jgi:1,4-dihydroxy-2-naphthoate octaprenyltransferase